MTKRGRPKHPDLLTPREQEVLSLIREGLTNPQIAERLGIGVEGVKYHVSEILSKLQVSSREEAASWREETRPWWLGAFALLRPPLRAASIALAGGVVVAAIAGLVFIAVLLVRSDTEGTRAANIPAEYSPVLYEAKLDACKSDPNGSTFEMAPTSRFFIRMPRELYPDGDFVLAGGSGGANYISNGGRYGYATSPDVERCWSTYFELDAVGRIDFRARSVVPGVPDYVLHFVGEITWTPPSP